MVNLKRSIATFPGRFQPFHKEHLARVRYLLKKYNEVTICVFTTDINERNPYPLFIRTDMIMDSLTTKERAKVTISVNRWYGDIWTENPMLKEFFTNLGYTVKTFLKRTINATDIRARKKGWEKLVPKGARKWL